MKASSTWRELSSTRRELKQFINQILGRFHPCKRWKQANEADEGSFPNIGVEEDSVVAQHLSSPDTSEAEEGPVPNIGVRMVGCATTSLTSQHQLLFIYFL